MDTGRVIRFVGSVQLRRSGSCHPKVRRRICLSLRIIPPHRRISFRLDLPDRRIRSPHRAFGNRRRSVYSLRRHKSEMGRHRPDPIDHAHSYAEPQNKLRFSKYPYDMQSHPDRGIDRGRAHPVRRFGERLHLREIQSFRNRIDGFRRRVHLCELLIFRLECGSLYHGRIRETGKGASGLPDRRYTYGDSPVHLATIRLPQACTLCRISRTGQCRSHRGRQYVRDLRGGFFRRSHLSPAHIQYQRDGLDRTESHVRHGTALPFMAFLPAVGERDSQKGAMAAIPDQYRFNPFRNFRADHDLLRDPADDINRTGRLGCLYPSRKKQENEPQGKI